MYGEAAGGQVQLVPQLPNVLVEAKERVQEP